MKTALFILVIMFSVVLQAFADESSLRCKSGLIMLGETKIEVLSKCGEPGSKSTVDRKVAGSSSSRVLYVTVEEWTYNFGPRDFIYTLEFQGSKLIGINRGERGF